MALDNGFFQKMCNEAMEELTSGKKTWRDVETNVLILACFGMMFNHLSHKIARPLWWVAGSAVTAAIGYIVHLVLI